MNRFKNVLKAFDNSEQATIEVSYCSVDDLYTIKLKHGLAETTAEHANLDGAMGEIIEYVQALKGGV